MSHYRVMSYWSGRDESPRDLGRQIAGFLGALGALHPRLGGWRFTDRRTGEPAPAGSPVACQEALEQRQIPWAMGAERRISYRPRFYLEAEPGAPVTVTITCGIPRLDLGPAFTPNRLEMLVRADVGDERAGRAALEGALREAVAAFRPDWGFAGTDAAPTPPLPIFSDGAPVVGWMTYLSAAYPPLPAALPSPAVAYAIQSLGTLIVAHPALFVAREPAHREAVARVDEALRAAGVLLPAHALGAPPA